MDEDVDLDDLVARAKAARDRAYAPYSRFLVGAAVATDAGTFDGANVENASYGLSICAERVAAATGVAAGARRIIAIAVTSSASGPTAPCGACRQFLHEFNPDMVVVSQGGDGERKRWRLSELLPVAFGPDDLQGP
ncbi:MAG TPA: cytidine deaminase [Actinomycetota bacterium]